MKKTIIAFDLDGVIIDKPPIIPKKILERLFRGPKEGKKLNYRFPKTRIEKIIRKFSHYYLFRPPIKENIEFIKKLSKNSSIELYIISARYSFLKNETTIWLEKNNLNLIFKKIYINHNNQQPHLFKEQTIKEIKPDVFIDDDDQIIDYLKKCNISCKLCYFDKTSLEKII